MTREDTLRYWAALNDLAMEEHGTETGIAARRKANQVADDLGDFSEHDWGIIRNAQRQYREEAQTA